MSKNKQPYAVWMDIPVKDLGRAMNFYSKLLNIELEEEGFQGMSMAVFPHQDGQAGACLFKDDHSVPSENGILVYFCVEGRLDFAIKTAEAEGGKVIMPKHQIGPHGYRAIVLDSEGNRIALHSMVG